MNIMQDYTLNEYPNQETETGLIITRPKDLSQSKLYSSIEGQFFDNIKDHKDIEIIDLSQKHSPEISPQKMDLSELKLKQSPEKHITQQTIQDFDKEWLEARSLLKVYEVQKRGKYYHCIRKIILISGLAIFILQILIFTFNEYLSANLTLILYKKQVDDIIAIYVQNSNVEDKNVCLYVYSNLNTIFPTTFDMIFYWISITINLIVLQQSVGVVNTVANVFLTFKDFIVIAMYLYEQDQIQQIFINGFNQWGYLFLRTNFSIPIVLSFLNLCIIRYGYFKALISKNLIQDFYLYGKFENYEYMCQASLTGLIPKEGSDYFRKSKTNYGTGSLRIYFTVLFIILIINIGAGSILLILGFSSFFISDLFQQLLEYLLFKKLFKNVYYARELQISLIGSFDSDKLLEKINQEKINEIDTIQLKKLNNRIQNIVLINYLQIYPMLFLQIYLLHILITYGSLVIEGANLLSLIKFLYATPLQMTFNVLVINNPIIFFISRILSGF